MTSPDKAAVAAVRPLEWRVSRYGQLADTLLGLYRIDDDAPRFYVQGSGFSKNCGSYEEAKAAAQADYAARILSALDPAALSQAAEPVGYARPMMQHPPLRKSDEDPAWMQVIKLFRRHGMTEPPVRLRDELVTALDWAWYGHAVALSEAGRSALKEEGET